MSVVQNLALFNSTRLPSVAQNTVGHTSLPILTVNETTISPITTQSGAISSQVSPILAQNIGSVKGTTSQIEQLKDEAFSASAVRNLSETSVTAKAGVATSSKPFNLITHLVGLKSKSPATPQADVSNKRDANDDESTTTTAEASSETTSSSSTTEAAETAKTAETTVTTTTSLASTPTTLTSSTVLATALSATTSYNVEEMKGEIDALKAELKDIPKIDQWGEHQLKYEGKLIPLIKKAFALIDKIADHNDAQLNRLYDLVHEHKAGFKHVTYTQTYAWLELAYQDQELMVNGHPKSPLSGDERRKLESSGYYKEADTWARLHKYTRWVEATRTEKAKYRIISRPHVIPKEQVPSQYSSEEMYKTAMFCKFGYWRDAILLPNGWRWNKNIAKTLVHDVRLHARQAREAYRAEMRNMRDNAHQADNSRNTLARLRHARRHVKDAGAGFRHHQGRIWSRYGISAYVLENQENNELVLTIGGTTAGKHTGGLFTRLMSNYRASSHHLTADLALFWGDTHRIFDEAAALAKAFQDYARTENKKYKIVGHSLGGALAVHGACMCSNPAHPYLADTIGSAPSNRGMKLEIVRGNLHLIDEKAVQGAISNIRNIVIAGDPVPTVYNWFNDLSLIGKVYEVEVEAPYDKKGGMWRHSNYDHILERNHLTLANRTTSIADRAATETKSGNAQLSRSKRHAVSFDLDEARPPSWLDDFDGQAQELDIFIQEMQKKPEGED